MTIAIFVVGILVFLITVYGTVVVGGLFLTDRQLEEHPRLASDAAESVGDDDDASRVRRAVSSEF